MVVPSLVLLAVVTFGALCLYHYRLPGLYYDESFDVVPSMQLLKGEPVQLARGVGIHLFGRDFPVMTGDYWGSVSTYAVLPLFWLLGVGVLPVRLWPIGAGMVAVLLTYVHRQATLRTLGRSHPRRGCWRSSPHSSSGRASGSTSFRTSSR